MRWTQTLIPTQKETPEGAEVPSHVLMIRAGLVGQLMAGAYTYLPLGLRSLQKAASIIREEMNAAGAVELLMPAITPLSLWERTGRVEAFGDVLIKFAVSRQNRKVHMALGPTHEEVITDLVARHISSYRQLPINLYQIQTKFRNEERPRFGVLRTSEFLMKDAYSFSTSLEDLNVIYEKMYGAYCRIFDRCGLDYLPVEAESGPIGGDASHEFMIPADNGEDQVAHCAQCGYAANVEKAESGKRMLAPPDVPMDAVNKVPTPDAGSITAVCAMLHCKPQRMIKTLIYWADEKPICILLRGDHEANEGKIRRAVGAEKLELAPVDVIEKVTGAPVGFAGPVGMAETIPTYADFDIAGIRNGITGANEVDAHYMGVNPGRDFVIPEERFFDLRNVVDRDPCPKCPGTLQMRPAIEVGHVFKLGTKYSAALGAQFLDANEERHDIIMGCYGIGVNRILAGLIETNHDPDGIIWPVSLAPYEVILVPMKVTDEETMEETQRLESQLTAAGVDVLVDDRDARPGFKFKDADLIGIPLRVVIGPRGLAEGKLEVKWRWEAEARMIEKETAVEIIAQWIQAERAEPTQFKARRTE